MGIELDCPLKIPAKVALLEGTAQKMVKRKQTTAQLATVVCTTTRSVVSVKWIAGCVGLECMHLVTLQSAKNVLLVGTTTKNGKKNAKIVNLVILSMRTRPTIVNIAWVVSMSSMPVLRFVIFVMSGIMAID